VYIIPARASSTDNDNLKNAVMTYGAVMVSMYMGYPSYYNPTYSAYYYSGSNYSNHAVDIVGWDDNYSKTKFSTAPPGNGAFIVRNSWGSSWGEAGYFYVSYYDKVFASDDLSYSFREAEPTTNFSRVYQYDPYGWVSSVGYGLETGWLANIFTAAASERLYAVSFYAASPNSPYEIYIYTGVTPGVPRSGTLAANQTGTLQMPGYNTISLSSPANLTSGERFSIVVKLTTPGTNYPIPYHYQYPGYTSAATSLPGQSFIGADGNSWMDLTSWEATGNLCLKGFTGPNSSLYATFTVSGIWQWELGTWNKIQTVNPVSMVSSGSILYADFAGDGLYQWNGTAWTKLTPSHPASMVPSGSTLYADFAGDGLYQWNGTAWTKLTKSHPASMVPSGSTLYADFAAYGLYQWSGTAWTLLTTSHPAGMVSAGSILYADFAAYGLYQWNGTAWSQLTTSHPAIMDASGSVLYAAFASLGIYEWGQSSTWTQLTPNNPTNIVVGF
jgi:hypothetical protein